MVIKIMKPGKKITHQQPDRTNTRPEAKSEPQSGNGGGIPSPRKPKLAVASAAEAMLRSESTVNDAI
jgi:hypothetical protein